MFHIETSPEEVPSEGTATCTLLNIARNTLQCFNSHKRTIRIKAAYAISWAELMKLMTEVYCPRNKIQKMETELMGTRAPGNKNGNKIENQTGGNEATARAYTIRGGENPDSNFVTGDDCDNGSKSKLNIISCTKTQKYMQKGCQVYLAQVTFKKTEDKSEEKRLEDLPIEL
ncbi:hypothetical protein Tco_0005577 [Tanacetum coccineum]